MREKTDGKGSVEKKIEGKLTSRMEGKENLSREKSK
jgi:hypothetical protein